ncbi:MAG: TetR/AcrR family transcriptional regulator [Balneolales bacterium]
MNTKEELQKRARIVNAALDLYVNESDKFTLKNIAKKARVKEAEIYSYFPNKTAILKDFYSGIVPQYKEMIREIEGFDQYDLSEKLSNFVYSSLDMMQERRDFVEKTFDDLIVGSYQKPEFQYQVERLVEDFVKEDPRIAGSNQYLLNSFSYNFLSKEYLKLVRFWIGDESAGSEKTMALTDKLTAFLNEILYTSVLDKGFDLGHFLVTNRIIRPNIPFWENCVEQFVNRGTYK